MKILIAEDEVMSRKLLQSLLTKWGHEVTAVDNGEKALQALDQADAPKLVILDWMMPVMDGLDVCRQIRTQDSQEPPYLIILTARSERKDLLEAFTAGADDFLHKPFNSDELQARLNAGIRILILQEQLVNFAKTDVLTGIGNRRKFFELATAEISRSRRYRYPLTIGLLDIDHFKKVNDTYGHDSGDAVLKTLASVFSCSLRGSDTICRVGGEEFAFLLPHTKLAQGVVAAERIRHNSESCTIQSNQHQIKVTVSIGLVHLSDPTDTIDTLLKKADLLLYRAKSSGRNRVETDEIP